MVRVIEPTKTCTRCGERKPWSAFYAAAKWEDGTMRRPQSRCKACNAVLTREYQHRTRRENPELAREKERRAFARLKADPERMELWRARHRDYQAQRRRAAGKVERPRCSPYGRAARGDREIPSAPFAAWVRSVLERDETSITDLSARWGVGDKTMRTVLNGRPTVMLATVERALIADATMTLMELYPELYSATDKCLNASS